MDPKHMCTFEKNVEKKKKKKNLDSHPVNGREKQKMNSDADGLCMGGKIV